MNALSDYEPLTIADACAISQKVNASPRDILRCAHDLQMERRTIVKFSKDYGWFAYGRLVNQHELTYSKLPELPEKVKHPVMGLIHKFMEGK